VRFNAPYLLSLGDAALLSVQFAPDGFFPRHGDGTNVSFADGHSAYWKYMGAETIQVGKMVNPPHNFAPQTDEGLADLQKMQKAVWGRLGY
jgi:prepilin-type processing-associated H-X9-DG protein